MNEREVQSAWCPADLGTWDVDPAAVGAPPRRVVEQRQRLGWIDWLFALLGLLAGTAMLFFAAVSLFGVWLLLDSGIRLLPVALLFFAAGPFAVYQFRRCREYLEAVPEVLLHPFRKSQRRRQLETWPCASAVVTAVTAEGPVERGSSRYRAAPQERAPRGTASLALSDDPSVTCSLRFEAPLGVGDEVTVLLDPRREDMIPLRQLEAVYLVGRLPPSLEGADPQP